MNRLIAVLLLALSACAAPSNPTRPAAGQPAFAAVYPTGIRAFKNPAAAVAAGLYASSSIRACCFIKRHASLTLEKPAGMRTAVLRFFVPNASPFKSGQSVTVSAAGTSATVSNVAGKWIVISLALPNAYASRALVPVEINVAKSFVPQKLGINGDTRELGVMLQKVEYQ